MVVGFYDFTKAVHEAKKRLEEEVLTEYKVKLEEGLVFEFLKEGRAIFFLEIIPLFKKNVLSFQFRSTNEIENDEYERVVAYFGELFPQFDLLEIELRGKYTFSQTRSFEKKYQYSELSPSNYYLAHTENGVKLMELLNSECLEMNPYKDNFWFCEQGKLFDSFEFHLEIDFEIVPKACLVVRSGEVENHSLYHHEYYEGNILKKLYNLEEIQSFYEELQEINQKIKEANEPLNDFLEKELDYQVSGYGIELSINGFGMGYHYNGVSHLIDYEDEFYGMDLEKAKKTMLLDMAFVRKTKHFAQKIHQIFEELDYAPQEGFRETFGVLLDRYERVEFVFKQFHETFIVRAEMYTSSTDYEEITKKPGFSLEDFSFQVWDSSSKDQRTMTGGEFLVELENVVKQDRNKQRISSLFEAKR